MRTLATVLILAAVASAAGAAPAAAPADTKDVSGLTVPGKRAPPKKCGEDDDVCIAAVAAELKARYPKAFARWCLDQALLPMREELLVEQLGDAQASRSGGFGGTFKEAKVAKQVCSPAPK